MMPDPSVSLSEASIRNLKFICASNVEKPAYYKGNFHWNGSGRAAHAILAELGIRASLNGDTGRVTFDA